MQRLVGSLVCLLAWLGRDLSGLAAEPLNWTDGRGFRVAHLPARPVGRPGFTLLPSASTGLNFTNSLRGDAYLTNAVAHNGAGVAIGDIDGDGWADLYLCSLGGPNRLYRNLGQWRFQELDAGPAACVGQVSTGCTFADVDGDGDLDLLVNGIGVGTRLFLNDGHGGFTEVIDSGLSHTASATSLALADIDGDGDLDLYCTHFIDAMHLADPTTRFALARKGDQWEVAKINGESTRSPKWKGRFEALPDGKVRELPEVHGLYRNDGRGHFTAIENEPGTYLDETGKAIPPFRDWGLAVMFRDLNGDGIPDLYVCNDNTSPDRIWINSGKGTFRALDTLKLRHTSRSSMGVDFADLDRDGHDDFVVVDMLAREHGKRMNQLMRDRPSLLDTERMDERPQFNRNTLFFGHSDGSFTEAAFYAGVAATDWTWTPIFLDVDLDGYEDLLVTNGFEFDVMDQDSHNEIKDGRRRFTDAQLKRSMQIHPRWRTRNAAFRNLGGGRFEAAEAAWGFDHAGISYGMAAGDLDNDGDLDLVVNNLNEEASLYRNDAPAGRIEVRLKGRAPNTQGVGARVRLSGGTVVQAQEILCGGRYLSGDQSIRVFAAPTESAGGLRLDVQWRSGRTTAVTNVSPNAIYEISEGTEPPPTVPIAPRTAGPDKAFFVDVSERIQHTHTGPAEDDWSRQPTLPRRLSRLGPGVAWFDYDGDGWEDLILPGGPNGNLMVYHNEAGKSFRRIDLPAGTAKDAGSVVGWPDGQNHRRILASLTNPEAAPDKVSELAVVDPREPTLRSQLPGGAIVPGPIVVGDLDGDGDLDVFVGGRYRPGRYPEPVASSIWINQNGTLTMDAQRSEPFRAIGLVSGATWVDLDQDGRAELVLATEWGPIRIFRLQSSVWTEVTREWGLATSTGWWTSVTAGDFDGDGRMDLACGNWGLNTVYQLYQPGPLRLYYGEWNGDGSVQMIEAWKSGERWLPVHDRMWLEKGIPGLTVQFPTHQAFSLADLPAILGSQAGPVVFHEATELASVVLLNRGDHFERIPLPREAQLTPVFSLNVGDYDGDGREDLFCAQNFFGTASDISRDDAGRGLWLRGDGKGGFTSQEDPGSGLAVYGEQRGAGLVDFDHDGRLDLAITQNHAATKLYQNRLAKPGLRVVLHGRPSNPDGIGAQMRLLYQNGPPGPVRAVQAGSGYWSQDASAQLLGQASNVQSVWIRWAGGREQQVSVPAGSSAISVVFPE